MDRPIAYNKLARADRFVRMRAREVAELKVAQGRPPFPDLSTRESIKERVHGIMVGELQAMEGAGRTVCDFPDAPWEFTMDMARQVWDESRHVEIYLRLLEHLEGYAGEFPETTILWRCACAEDAAARVAGVNRGLEGLACDVFNQLVYIARKIGDPILERAVDFVLADEITHVRMGSKWLTRLTEGDPERRRRAIEFQESIDERFNLGGVRREGDHDAAPISVATDGRRLGGPFSADHSARLLRNYRYVVERTMRAVGGWIALTPEISAKLVMGRHVWDLAQHCDAVGRRLPELRAHAQVSEPANPEVVRFMDRLEEPEGRDQTVERLVGVYSALKPHLLATYRGHLARSNSVYEPPTRRILARCIADEERHIAEGRAILRQHSTDASVMARVASRQRCLEGVLLAAHGVTGDAVFLAPAP